MSIAVQPAMAPSSSSVGMQLVSLPVPNVTWSPRVSVTVNAPWVTRSTGTVRCEEPSVIPMPCQVTTPPRGQMRLFTQRVPMHKHRTAVGTLDHSRADQAREAGR